MIKISHIICISKISIDLCFTKQRIKTKIIFTRVVYVVLVAKNVLTKHEEVCLSINGAQYVWFEKITIEFNNYFKQIPVRLKVYADFECNFESVESYESPYSKKYQDHIPCSFAYKLVCVDEKFIKPIVDFGDENDDVKKVIKSILTKM